MRRDLRALALACAIPTAAFAQSLTPACEAAMGSPTPKVKLTTSKGPIVLQLDKEKAPVSTANFVKYVGKDKLLVAREAQGSHFAEPRRRVCQFRAWLKSHCVE